MTESMTDWLIKNLVDCPIDKKLIIWQTDQLIDWHLKKWALFSNEKLMMLLNERDNAWLIGS